MANETGKAVGVLVASMIGALILSIFGDVIVDVAFEAGSTGETLVDYAPLVLVALGFYGAFTVWTED